MNQINIIHPYLDHGSLVFDDSDRGLIKEAFVAGADSVLIGSAVRAGIKDPTRFTLVFSARIFPGYQDKAEHIGKGDFGSGDWYSVNGIQAWSCPALLKYFETAPKTIYFQIKERV